MSKVKNRKIDFLSNKVVTEFYLDTDEVNQVDKDSVKANSGEMLLAPVLGAPNSLYAWDGNSWAIIGQANSALAMDAGSQRPSNPVFGRMFFDTTLTPTRAIVWNGTAWVNMDGTSL